MLRRFKGLYCKSSSPNDAQPPLQHCIYLPPNYDYSTEYPILYHLHGLQVPFSGMVRDVKWTAQQFEVLGKEIIIAAPLDPTSSSFWLNGNQIQMMDMVLNEFISMMESQYKTSRRFLQGFSMGGLGAVRYSFTGTFEKVISWDGALHDWQTLTSTFPNVARSHFGNDERKFDSVFTAATVDDVQTPILLFTGKGFDRFGEQQAIKFIHHLDQLGVATATSVSRVKTEHRHTMKRFVHAHGKEAVQFLLTES